MVNSILQFKNITKSFGKHVVLNKLNFDIERGDIFGIIGLSGSGKTTILNLLIGFLKANTGEILFKSRNISNYKNNIRQLFGFATQGGAFYPSLSVKENLQYFGRMYNLKNSYIQKRTKKLLEIVNLHESYDAIASHLSTGMSRRLDIACALIHNPEILILDEPTEDLDPVLRKEVLGLIRKINHEEDTTIVLTSHLLNEMEEICDKIAILHYGKILEQGTPDELKGHYSKNEEIILKSNPGDYKRIVSNLGIKNPIIKKDRVIFYVQKAEIALPRLLRKLKNLRENIVELNVSKPSLEEVFESVTKR